MKRSAGGTQKRTVLTHLCGTRHWIRNMLCLVLWPKAPRLYDDRNCRPWQIDKWRISSRSCFIDNLPICCQKIELKWFRPYAQLLCCSAQHHNGHQLVASRHKMCEWLTSRFIVSSVHGQRGGSMIIHKPQIRALVWTQRDELCWLNKHIAREHVAQRSISRIDPLPSIELAAWWYCRVCGKRFLQLRGHFHSVIVL